MPHLSFCSSAVHGAENKEATTLIINVFVKMSLKLHMSVCSFFWLTVKNFFFFFVGFDIGYMYSKVIIRAVNLACSFCTLNYYKF